MAADEIMMEGLKERLGYNDAEWEMWLKEPKNLEIAQNAVRYSSFKLVAEVTKSRGCMVGHKVGDRLLFDGSSGTFIGKEPAGGVCVGLLTPVLSLVGSVFCGIMGGVDPQRLLVFPNVRCMDVGIENNGWGEVLVRMTVEK